MNGNGEVTLDELTSFVLHDPHIPTLFTHLLLLAWRTTSGRLAPACMSMDYLVSREMPAISMCKLVFKTATAAEDQCPVITPRNADPNPKRASPGLGSMHRRSRIELNAMISR